MSDKEPWADEPTPLCDKDKLRAWDCRDGEYRYFIPEDLAGDLERRLRHAWKLVNSLRIDAMHMDEAHGPEVDPAILEQQLSVIEGVLQ